MKGKCGMNRKATKGVLVSGVTACLLVAGTGVADAAQGGRDGDHFWMKISKTEFRQNGSQADKPCVRALPATMAPGPSRDACRALAFWVERAAAWNPCANGYWSEWYPKSGKTRAGAWR